MAHDPFASVTCKKSLLIADDKRRKKVRLTEKKPRERNVRGLYVSKTFTSHIIFSYPHQGAVREDSFSRLLRGE